MTKEVSMSPLVVALIALVSAATSALLTYTKGCPTCPTCVEQKQGAAEHGDLQSDPPT